MDRFEIVEQIDFLSDAGLDQLVGFFGDVDTKPVAMMSLRSYASRGASAEGIKYYVSLVRANLDNPLQECYGFLGGIAYALFGLGLNGLDIVPYITHWNSRHIIKK